MFWSPPEDDLDDHHEFSLVKLLSFRPIGLSLALGYLFQESPHDLSPFRTSVARQRCMRCGRIGFWRFGLGPGITDRQQLQKTRSGNLCLHDAYEKWCLQMFTTELTPISVEYWVMTLHTKLVPSGFVTIQKSQTLTSCEKNCGIPQVAILYRKIYDQPSTFWAPYFNFRQAQVFCWCCSIQFKV